MATRANLYGFGLSGIGGLYAEAVGTVVCSLPPQNGAWVSDTLGRAKAKAEREAREGRKGKREPGRVREAEETKEQRTRRATRRCLKNRQIVTVSLTVRAVLIKC